MAAAGEHGTITEVAISVLVTVFVYWIAQAYAEVLGGPIIPGQPLAFADVVRGARRHWTLVEAALAPLVVLLVAYAIGASRTVAINAGLTVTTLLLVIVGWIAAMRRGSKVTVRVVSALLAGSFGLASIGRKAVLH